MRAQVSLIYTTTYQQTTISAKEYTTRSYLCGFVVQQPVGYCIFGTHFLVIACKVSFGNLRLKANP